MISIVHLKWGECPPDGDVYLLITRQGRVRGEDYYVRAVGALSDAGAPFDQTPSFASLDSALRRAESVAAGSGAATVYVKLEGRFAAPSCAA